MTYHDFDPEIQEIFSSQFGDIPLSNWESWLSISDREEYEDVALKESGLPEDSLSRVYTEKTDPRSFSVDVDTFLKSHEEPVVVFCHTSGTSGGSIKDVKWFYLSKELMSRLWAPGMQAIFEKSGLSSGSAAVVFVPSRGSDDGLFHADDKKVVKLYSAEFSQRLVLSIIHPGSYVLYEYKDSRTIEVLAELLTLDRISVVSAPFLTLLGWADLGKLRRGLEKSLHEPVTTLEGEQLKKRVEALGVEAAALTIREELSQVLSDATLIFSATAMTENEWKMLRQFLNWKKGEEKVTNLYVGSELGPFAASLNRNWDTMHVFPLTIPVIEQKGNKELISRTHFEEGRLLVSRMHNGEPLVNIDMGDVISLKDQEGLPLVHGEVLRAGFRLKRNVITNFDVDEKFNVFVGSYFDLDGLKIRNPRLLVKCLSEKCGGEGALVVRAHNGQWDLMVPVKEKGCSEKVRGVLPTCPGGDLLGEALSRGDVDMRVVEEPAVLELSPSEASKKVRNGTLPKGVLKKWSLYVLVPPDMSPTFV
ncbi:MAG: hypothetical protein WBA22_09915 [Candidatus Methanofastidiosia archaeon]